MLMLNIESHSWTTCFRPAQIWPNLFCKLFTGQSSNRETLDTANRARSGPDEFDTSWNLACFVVFSGLVVRMVRNSNKLVQIQVGFWSWICLQNFKSDDVNKEMKQVQNRLKVELEIHTYMLDGLNTGFVELNMIPNFWMSLSLSLSHQY